MLKVLVVSLILFVNSIVLAGKTNKFVNVTANPGELCNRECIENDRKVCYFNFVLEHYHAMGSACKNCAQGVLEDCDHDQCIVGDGTERGVMSINRMIPGPAIQVCKNDMVIVDLVNKAQGTGASIHWHGMHMRKTPYMDGVPFGTQCPIPSSSTFRYVFEASEAGTKFYHSHSGHHKTNGHYGALIIREPKKLVANINEYDFDLDEHYILISDWLNTYAENTFPGLPSNLSLPESILINGRGYRFGNPKFPVTKYFVEPGKRYRFRVINSLSLNCPVQIQIAGHTMTVIATDSSDVKPLQINTLGSNSGERFDFVLTANYTKGDFWIRVSPMSPCNVEDLDTFALLRYKTEGMADDELKAPQLPPYHHSNITYLSDKKLNDAMTCSMEGKEGNTDYCITDLTSLNTDEDLLSKTPDHTFILPFDAYVRRFKDTFRKGNFEHFMNIIGNTTAVGAVNNISFILPSSPPLTQLKDVDENEICNADKMPKRCDGQQLCHCVHVLKVKKNSIVELIIYDESNGSTRNHHPFHLHGYNFMVTGYGKDRSDITMNLSRKINKNNNPLFKDTVSIPSRGYVILKFRADNPGYWLLHCHNEWHLSVGMGLIIQVGKPKDMIAAPKDFPKCGSYVPKIKQRFFD